jgi:hypothetical protein
MKAVFNFIFSYVNIYSSLVCFENYNLLLVMGGPGGDVIHALAAISLVAISFVPLLCSFAVPFVRAHIMSRHSPLYSIHSSTSVSTHSPASIRRPQMLVRSHV